MTRKVFGCAVACLLLTAGAFSQQRKQPEVDLQAAIRIETVDGDLNAAIEKYKTIANTYATSDRTTAAQALLRMAECYTKIGDAHARAVFEQIVREYADQKAIVEAARARLDSPQATAATQTARRVAVIGGPDYPAVSPNGRWFTYRSSQTFELIARDLTTGVEHAVTQPTASGQAVVSAVSVDDRTIAYGWREGTGFSQTADVRILPLVSDTSTPKRPRVIHRSAGDELEVRPIGWLPDGAGLVVTRRLADRTEQLGIMSTGDGSIRVLKSLDWNYPNASVSPDGRYIAYDGVAEGSLGARGARDIFVMATDGSREVLLVRGAADDFEPMWSPDGRDIFFRSDRSGTRALWRVQVLDARPVGAPRMVKADFAGKLLTITRTGVLHYVVWSGGQNVYTAELDGDLAAPRTPELLGDRTINGNYGPAWSPDGRFLAYYSSRGLQTTLIVHDATRLVDREMPLDVGVTKGEGFKAAPIWFPDGRSLLVVGGTQQRLGGKGYYRLDLQTGRLELIIRPRAFGAPIFRPAISPDGRSLYHPEFANQPPTRTVVRYDLETKQARELAQAPEGFFFANVALSPDGRELACLLKADATPAVVVQIMPSGGGAARDIAHTTSTVAGGPLVWTGDQQALLVVGGATDDTKTLRSPQSIWRIPVSGGKPENTGLTFDAIGSFSVHPGRRRLTFDAREPSSAEVWTLDNLLASPSRK